MDKLARSTEQEKRLRHRIIDDWFRAHSMQVSEQDKDELKQALDIPTSHDLSKHKGENHD